MLDIVCSHTNRKVYIAYTVGQTKVNPVIFLL